MEAQMSRVLKLTAVCMAAVMGICYSGGWAMAEEMEAAATPAPIGMPGMSAAPGPEAAPAQIMTKHGNFAGPACSKCDLKKHELEISWNAAIGMPTFSENSQTFDLSGAGFMLESNPGIKVTTAPGLDGGVAVGFIFMPSSGSFSVDYDGPPAETHNWDVQAISAGSYVMAKYNYDIDLDVLKIGFENGVGLGYFINSVDYSWVDASDSNITGEGSEEEIGWMPILRAGLKLALPVTKVSCLGLNVGGTLMPLMAGNYGNIFTVSVGLNYQVEY